MKYYEFNYNKKFCCIARNCKHNCCIGWEIKVDKKTANHYSYLSLTDNAFCPEKFEGNTFKLDQFSRCPFLENDNLCYVIKKYGEKSLSKTCKTHPRFKNFFSSITETGLGIYCEEACRIILSLKHKMKRVLVKDDKKNCSLLPFERKIFAFRNKVLKIIQDRSLTTNQKISLLSSLSNIDLNKNSFSKWLEIFSRLERLKTNEFSFSSIPLASDFANITDEFRREYEQLLSYFAFRHLSRAIDSIDLSVRLAFIVLAVKFINHIFSLQNERTFENLVEACRFFTSEIECNDDNLFKILNQIENLVSFI